MTARKERCPYHNEGLTKCGVRYAPVRQDEGMQAYVCFSDRHKQCKWYKAKSSRHHGYALVVTDVLAGRPEIVDRLKGKVACDIAVTVENAVSAYMISIKTKQYYDAIFVNFENDAIYSIEFVSMIRRFEQEAAGIEDGIPIFVVAGEDSGFKEQCRAMGCMCVSRPVDAARIASEIELLVCDLQQMEG